MARVILILLAALPAFPRLALAEGERPADRAAALVSSAAFKFSDRALAAPGSFVFSPYALYTSFAMVGEAARGATAEGYRALFGFAETSGTARAEYYAARRSASRALKGLDFVNAGALWYQKGYELDPALEELLRKGYAAAPQTSDFRSAPGRAVTDINSWLSKRTRGGVKNLFPAEAFDRMTRLVLANGVWFKGAWRYGFEVPPAETAFALADGSTAAVSAVSGGPWPLAYYGDEELTAVALDYYGGGARLLLLLPAEGVAARDFLRNLNAETLAAVRGALKVPPGGVRVTLPLLRLQSAWDLARELPALGLSAAFGPESDYSGLTGRRELALQKAMQGAALELAPEGGPQPRPAKGRRRGRPLHFAADRPFVFLVEEKASGLLLFLGLVEDPRG